jgi:putative ABC transport system permease protein
MVYPQRLKDISRISLRRVWRQRRRCIGVAAAIALGTAGFVVIITMGSDVKANLNRDLALLGGATIVRAYFPTEPGSRPQWFLPRTRKAIERIQGVGATSLAAVRYSVTAVERDRSYWFNLVAVDEFFWDVNSFSPVSGTFFRGEAVAKREKVCVLGDGLARKIFGATEAVGRLLLIDRDLYRIVGLLGGLGVSDQSDFAFIPLTTALNRIPGLTPPNRMYIRCRSWDDVEGVADQIPQIVREVQSEEGLRVDVAREQLRRVKRAVWWITLFVSVSISATLALGGIGIWNGMMTSVMARTREIGLKKAFGAEDGDILTQFLGEALFLSLGGALLGVIAGRLIIETLSFMLKTDVNEILFFTSSMSALGFAMILGVGAGLYPAIRASRMEVASAVRYE